ncbi:sulfite oxidase-like [Anneissia japonica]|uniref:sulfite oxidase-like n=1 Tax=Anneissia japonica TaxID=1529436 RepID=UPI0014255A4A|nr:sulfite oxidase-like [Anneissia japonica]
MAPMQVMASGYKKEPRRALDFTINQSTPFNAEPPVTSLRDHFVTPNEKFYIRNHAPVPVIDGESYKLVIEGLVAKHSKFSIWELKNNFTQHTVMATLMVNSCLYIFSISDFRGIHDILLIILFITNITQDMTWYGVGWGCAAISNAVWKGPRLRDVLLSAGIEKLESFWDQLHVNFEGVDICKDNQGYGSSIPLHKALDKRGDVILALEMNGSELPRDHGYPVRVVVPGYIGARSVKWLKTITVQMHESTNYFQKKDYKLFLPEIDWDTVDEWWDKSVPIQELNVQAAITQPKNNEVIPRGSRYTIKGYALSGGGRKIVRVDISLDGGKSWTVANLFTSSQGLLHIDTKWSWEFWDCTIKSMPSPCQIVCRAWDEASNTMPEDIKQIWNLRGVMNNSWVRVNVVSDAAKL